MALAHEWREAFGEPPPVLDAELMRPLLAELKGQKPKDVMPWLPRPSRRAIR